MGRDAGGGLFSPSSCRRQNFSDFGKSRNSTGESVYLLLFESLTPGTNTVMHKICAQTLQYQVKASAKYGLPHLTGGIREPAPALLMETRQQYDWLSRT